MPGPKADASTLWIQRSENCSPPQQDSDGDSRTGYGGRGLPIRSTQPHRTSPYPLMRPASSVVGPSQNPASGAAHSAAGHHHPSFPHNTGCLAKHAVTPPARHAPHHHLTTTYLYHSRQHSSQAKEQIYLPRY